MSNFNEYFKNTLAKDMVDRLMVDIDAWSENKITKYRFEFEESDELKMPASYFLENGLTALHRVIIHYELNHTTQHTSSFDVPREIDGVFILEGAFRMATSVLNSDFECRFTIGDRKGGEDKITFDYTKVFHVDKGILRIKIQDKANYGSATQMDIRMNDLAKALQDPEKEPHLRLTDHQKKKLSIKLDLEKEPTHITKDLIEKCIEFGDDRDRDLIIDKQINSVATGFKRFLFKENFGQNFARSKRLVRNSLQKYGKLPEVLNSVNYLCFRYWKNNGSEKDKEIQTQPGVNAMNLDSYKSKISFHKTIAYNTSMADLIDIADTPINGNTNLQNSLTVSCHVMDDDTYFDVYDKEFNKITIPYMDYMNLRVVASECVDYETKKVVPQFNSEGKPYLEIKHRMRRKKAYDLDEYDLIDLHPDFRLSTSTRRIPFVNFTDSVRVSMGTSMLKQSIPISNAQRPLVDTGNWEDLQENGSNSRLVHDSAVVKAITESDVVLKTPEGEVKIPRKSAIKSIYNVTAYFEPKVKVGQKLKKGDVVVGPVGLEHDTVKSGLNANVLFHAYHGLVNEDAVVVSESFADRMSSYSIIDTFIEVKHTSKVTWIAPIGTKVKSKDNLVTLSKKIKLNDVNKAANKRLGGLLDGGDDLGDFTVESYLKVPENIDDAIVSDVCIQENVKPIIEKTVKEPDYTYSRSSRAYLDKYESTIEKDRKIMYKNYPDHVAADRLKPINLDPEKWQVVYHIQVRLIKYSRVVIGEKLTSRYGGKGVVSRIVPDHLMPKLADGSRVEVVLNPYSTINRKIPSVIMEVGLGNIAKKLHSMVEELKLTSSGKKKIMPLISKYYKRYKGMDVDEFLEKHNTLPMEEVYHFNVGCFSSYTPQQIESWSEELGISTQTDVYMPESDLVDLNELKENLEPKEYEEYVKSIQGKMTKVEKPLMAGMMTLERLYHMPSYTNKVTSDMVSDPKKMTISGRGDYRGEGQVINYMELYALLARNATGYLRDLRKDTNKEVTQRFLDNLLGLGLMVVDEKGYQQGGSSVKSKLTELKYKFRSKKGGI